MNAGGRYDAFSSGHVYITTLLTLYLSRWHPRQRILWVLILVIASLSTLFTGRHYVLDVFGGYAVAFIGYQVGLGWAGFLPSQKRPGKKIASSSLN
jgi:membrane-associated phospholipid phosphatase